MVSKYGQCECGSSLSPVWFIEEETVVECGIMIKTGRTRRACSHLECSNCCRREIVDDSFDGYFK